MTYDYLYIELLCHHICWYCYYYICTQINLTWKQYR